MSWRKASWAFGVTLLLGPSRLLNPILARREFLTVYCGAEFEVKGVFWRLEKRQHDR